MHYWFRKEAPGNVRGLSLKGGQHGVQGDPATGFSLIVPIETLSPFI